jgi:RimJ/RimL family protein N-acetyltransferase
MPTDRPEVHLRVAIPEDATWLAEVDAATGGVRSPAMGFEADGLRDELEAGEWASDDRWAWAVVVDGEPAGFALVTGMESGDGQMQIRLRATERGRGVGREVLHQLADHHFAAHAHLQRLVGETHEHNIPMQRAFNAAGFRMEARYRDSMPHDDGSYAARWGYALTRQDWTAGRHRLDDDGYDLHGLTFIVDEVLNGPKTGSSGLTFEFLQEGRRASATFFSHEVNDGELAGVLIRDVLRYRYVQELHRQGEGHIVVTGRGRARLQRAHDGRLQVINEWADDEGRHGTTLLVERR